MQSQSQHLDVGAGSDARNERTYIDVDGGHWRVFEQAFGDYDRKTGASLIFSNDSAVRRVRDYPANWMSLSEADLAALSWKS